MQHWTLIMHRLCNSNTFLMCTFHFHEASEATAAPLIQIKGCPAGPGCLPGSWALISVPAHGHIAGRSWVICGDRAYWLKILSRSRCVDSRKAIKHDPYGHELGRRWDPPEVSKVQFTGTELEFTADGKGFAYPTACCGPQSDTHNPFGLFTTVLSLSLASCTVSAVVLLLSREFSCTEELFLSCSCITIRKNSSGGPDLVPAPLSLRLCSAEQVAEPGWHWWTLPAPAHPRWLDAENQKTTGQACGRWYARLPSAWITLLTILTSPR